MPNSLAPRPRDPFDEMRRTRRLAQHDPRLNEIRWLAGEALRRIADNAEFELRSPDPSAVRAGVARGEKMAASEIATHARQKLRNFAGVVGEAHWDIVRRIVLEGAPVAACRLMIPEIVTPWRSDCCVMDRLRTALDRLTPLLKLELPR